MKILIVAGAGTSIELGVPVMRGMAEEFVEHSRQWNIEPDLVSNLIGKSMDIEYLIEEVDKICLSPTSVRLLGVDQSLIERIQKIRSEVEWFVQHAAERIVPKEAKLMWGGVLREASSHELTIATTNYDRAIELAANGHGIAVDDGFEEFGNAEIATWRNFLPSSGPITLIKLHGSTDWYATAESGAPVKLRHPMPLFGGAILRLPSDRSLGSALVLPSREKILQRQPYMRLSQAFHNAIDTTDMVIAVGSSMRDDHIKSATRQASNRVPTFIVRRSDVDCGIERSVRIRQSASAFLIGTLPAALATRDPIEFLRAVSLRKVGEPLEILEHVRIAQDQSVQPSIRCEAIEALEESAISPDFELTKALLADDSAIVAQYALSLVPNSVRQAELFELAMASPHATSESYSTDLTLLKGMLGGSRPSTVDTKV